jgi:phage recombination protein Bet
VNQELATIPETKPVSSLAIMAARLRADPEKLLSTLKATVFKGATNEEIMVLSVVANEYGLNPLIKEIYAFPAKGGGIVPIVSIDGWLRIINDHPQMDGMNIAFVDGPDGNPISCTCEIFRKDRSHATVVTEYFSECRRNTEPWKMAHRMLRHKAITQCGRVAFGFSGLQDEDEGRDASERVAKGREVVIARQNPVNPFASLDPAPLPAIPEDAQEWTDEEIDAKFPEEGGQS